MILRKINALVALMAACAVFVHAGYLTYAYLTFHYSHEIMEKTSHAAGILMLLHAVLSIFILLTQTDKIKWPPYTGLNKQTMAQRLTALVVLVMMFLHANMFKMLGAGAGSADPTVFKVLFAFLAICQTLFYAFVLTHVSLSLSKAFITLGILSSDKVRKTVDKVMLVFSAVFLVIASYSIIRGEVFLFLSGGGAS